MEEASKAPLSSLLNSFDEDPNFARIVDLSSNVIAVSELGRAFFISSLAKSVGRTPLVVVAATSKEAESLFEDLKGFLSQEVVLFPAWETLPFERLSPSASTMGERLEVISKVQNISQSLDASLVVVGSIKAFLQRLSPTWQISPIKIKKGDILDQHSLVQSLIEFGYRREYQVENKGEVSVRGNIVDVFPSTETDPIRIDLWGDEVERLTIFTPDEQRSIRDIEQIYLYPCREILPNDKIREKAQVLIESEPWARDRWERLSQGQFFEGMESLMPWLAKDESLLLDFIGKDGQVILLEPKKIKDRAKDLLAEEESLANALAITWGLEDKEEDFSFPRLHLPFDRLLSKVKVPIISVLQNVNSEKTPHIKFSTWQVPGVDGEKLIDQVKDLISKGFTVIACGNTPRSSNHLYNLFSKHQIKVQGPIDNFENINLAKPTKGITILTCWLSKGFILPSVKIAVLCDSDLSGRQRFYRPPRSRKVKDSASFDDLRVGSYVVHSHHGVGKFAGMVRRDIGGSERDYLLLEYRGGDKLYVPSDQMDSITPYLGGDIPAVHRLGGADWQKAKAKVRDAVSKIADELVSLYRRRSQAQGHAFSPDTPWQYEMEDLFAFEETPDQKTAIESVKQDMEQVEPMDRLILGDVGFGKTEIAIRAAFKAVQDGKQVAVLAPTTLLAHQHFQTFSERFSTFPIKVEVLSRFLSASSAREVIQGLESGDVDVVIGTHRLLSSGVKFKDLGLLVVDEEQRFGVLHKEAIKALRENVDVLTLAATPIPRTLEMSLTGIRDLSLLNTPPAERQPILTYVGEYEEQTVAEAIRRELLREGQVFFVHNRVSDIEQVAAKLKNLVKEARIAVAHGQMEEKKLEKVVMDFWQGEYDVLVCTTIIETGIDMSSVNTLVVDRADMLGLGQLHQLRGRVGRAGQRAYAYLLFPPDKSLSEQSYERLKTIGENTELGSGFKIAMRDLEMRGAGNLLGGDQSGHIAAVGYDLYVQMISEAVSELKGEKVIPPTEVKVEIPLDAFLPPQFIEREDVRLEAYKRLATVSDLSMVEDIRKEWLDRFGPIPPPAQTLLQVAKLRSLCVMAGIEELNVTTSNIKVGSGAKYIARLSPVRLKASMEIKLKRMYPRALYKQDQSQLIIETDLKADIVKELTKVIVDIFPKVSDSIEPDLFKSLIRS